MEKQKRKCSLWYPQDVQNAIAEFKKQTIGLNKCCRKYNIPKKTFVRHASGHVKRGVQTAKFAKLNGRQTAFPREMEELLVNHILKFEEMLFGLSINDVRRIAYELEADPSCHNPFNKEPKLAGKNWYYSFL